GSNGAAAALTTDQRGFNRFVNNVVDIGAYEFQPPATTTTLVSSVNPSAPGQSVTFTATVAGAVPGSNTPLGRVTFTIDGVAGAPVTLVNGVATFTTSTLSAGNHTVVAQYSGGMLGDITFSTSTSAPLSQVVKAASPANGIIAVGADAGTLSEVRVFDA